MTRPDEARGLVTWALGTFHATIFVLVGVLILYTRDALAPLLSSLNTLAGLGLFAVLWATTFVTTARALRGLELGAPGTESALLRRTFRFGAANGMLFLAVVGLVLGVGASVAAGSFPFFLFAAPFALVVAAAVGGVVGLIFGLVDLALLRIVSALVETGAAPQLAP